MLTTKGTFSDPAKNALAALLTATVFLTIFPVGAARAASPEFHVSNELSVTYNDVTGPGSGSSSLTEGFRYLDVANAYGNFTANGFDFNFNVGAKMTDDRTMDAKTISLTNFQGRATNRIHTFNVGDTFETFSQYSLASALKGASYRYGVEKTRLPEITIVSGYAYPRWDSIWGDAETKALTRQVTGLRLKETVSPNLFIAGSLLQSNDREGSRVFSSDHIYRNTLYALDAEYRPIPGLIISSELAFSNTSESPQEGAAVLDYSGNALKLNAVGDGGPSRVLLEYERVSPQFTTLLGSATADREKAKSTWRYKYSKRVTLNSGFLWWHDNLDGNKGGTTHHYRPDIGMTLARPFGRSSATADLSYRYDRATGGTATNPQNSEDQTVNLNYRDSFGMIDTDTNLGYSLFRAKTGIRDDSEFLFNTTVSSRHNFDQMVLKPSVYLGSRNLQDELAGTRDRIYEWVLGLGADFPQANVTSNLRVGENRLEKEVGTSSAKFFGSLNINWRPKALAKFNQGMLYVRAAVNDFSYSTTASDFRETSITAGINIQY